jgi:hypothetical protein
VQLRALLLALLLALLSALLYERASPQAFQRVYLNGAVPHVLQYVPLMRVFLHELLPLGYPSVCWMDDLSGAS